MTVRDSQCVNLLHMREGNGRYRFKRTRQSACYRCHDVALKHLFDAANTKRQRREKQEGDAGAKNKAHWRSCRYEVHCLTVGASTRDVLANDTFKTKNCINREEPGQPLKNSDNKIGSLIQFCSWDVYVIRSTFSSFLPLSRINRIN